MNKPTNFRELTPFESFVIDKKGTEKPFTGEYCNTTSNGHYHCKKCDAPLYRSADKFPSHCGWPSFDDEIPGAVKKFPDADGRRVEIVCQNCGGHLGHVFEGEGFTSKNIRHCVNSISLIFKANDSQPKALALFASGCFWGTEYHLAKVPGVLATKVGFAGGQVENPSYKQVCEGTTGHLECCEVTYNPKEVSYEQLCKLFFETHDFSQTDGQGPDIGPQYLSALFLSSDEERAVAEKLISTLKAKGYSVATQLLPAARFWSAEDYHQKYYFHQAKTPYCHIYRKIF
ncbi:bifunctional methionine sulfoxide reductase B/A protein [bacterium]|nr:bifunctional methionine sulfoxide reductase B/A protein [bacterium]